MASIGKLEYTKDGKRYWRVFVSKGKGCAPASARFYWPVNEKTKAPYSEKSALKALGTFAADFERQVKAGEILNRKETKERKAEEDRQRAELKTFKQYSENVYMARKRLELAETSRYNYQLMLDNHIYPTFGDLYIKDITPAMINKLLLDFQLSGKSFASSQKLYNILNGVFTSAFKDDTIPTLPMLKVEKPRQRKDEVKVPETEKTLSLEMLNYVLECVADAPLKWQAYIYLAADTGARRGELTGLQWSDINFKEQSVTLFRNAQYTPNTEKGAGKGVYITSPKNEKKRIVYIGQETITLLKALKEEQKTAAKEKAKKDHSKVVNLTPWVFNKDGTTDVMHPDSPTRYFRKFGEKYKIENFHPHLLRHTFASLAITEGGADIVSVSQVLGHSDTAITLRFYSHATAESVRRAGEGVRDALARQREQKTAENHN